MNLDLSNFYLKGDPKGFVYTKVEIPEDFQELDIENGKDIRKAEDEIRNYTQSHWALYDAKLILNFEMKISLIRLILSKRAEEYGKNVLEGNNKKVEQLENALMQFYRTLHLFMEKIDYYELSVDLTSFLKNENTIIDCLLYSDNFQFILETIAILDLIFAKSNTGDIPVLNIEKFIFFCHGLMKYYENSYTNLAELLADRHYFQELLALGKTFDSISYENLRLPSRIFVDKIDFKFNYLDINAVKPDGVEPKTSRILISSLSNEASKRNCSYSLFMEILRKNGISWPRERISNRQTLEYGFYQLLAEIKTRKLLKEADGAEVSRKDLIIDNYILTIIYLFDMESNKRFHQLFDSINVNGIERAQSNPAYQNYSLVKYFLISKLHPGSSKYWSNIWILCLDKNFVFENIKEISPELDNKILEVFIDGLEGLNIETQLNDVLALFRLLITYRGSRTGASEPLINALDQAINNLLLKVIGLPAGPILRGVLHYLFKVTNPFHIEIFRNSKDTLRIKVIELIYFLLRSPTNCDVANYEEIVFYGLGILVPHINNNEELFLTKEILYEILKSARQNLPMAHFVTNNLFFNFDFSASKARDIVTANEEKINLIFDIFSEFANLNKSLYLRNFQLIRSYVTKFIEGHPNFQYFDRQKENFKIYANVLIKNIVLWGDNSNDIKEDIKKLYLLKEEFWQAIKLNTEMFAQNRLDEEKEFLNFFKKIQTGVIKDTFLSRSLLKYFFLFLNQKYYRVQNNTRNFFPEMEKNDDTFGLMSIFWNSCSTLVPHGEIAYKISVQKNFNTCLTELWKHLQELPSVISNYKEESKGLPLLYLSSVKMDQQENPLVLPFVIFSEEFKKVDLNKLFESLQKIRRIDCLLSLLFPIDEPELNRSALGSAAISEILDDIMKSITIIFPQLLNILIAEFNYRFKTCQKISSQGVFELEEYVSNEDTTFDRIFKSSEIFKFLCKNVVLVNRLWTFRQKLKPFFARKEPKLGEEPLDVDFIKNAIINEILKHKTLKFVDEHGFEGIIRLTTYFEAFYNNPPNDIVDPNILKFQGCELALTDLLQESFLTCKKEKIKAQEVSQIIEKPGERHVYNYLKVRENFLGVFMNNLFKVKCIDLYAKEVFDALIFALESLSEAEPLNGFEKKARNLFLVYQSMSNLGNYYDRWNENLPIFLSGRYSEFLTKKDDDKILKAKKKHYKLITELVLNLFLKSTYQNSVRIRSCYFYSVIHKYLEFLVTQSEASTNYPRDITAFLRYKKGFAAYFIDVLRKHFQHICPQWALDCSELMTKIFEENHYQIPDLPINYEVEMKDLDHITSACTNAMVLNLVSRLIQDKNNLEPDLVEGIRTMFLGPKGIKGYCHYLDNLYEKLQEREMIRDEISTLENDTISNCVNFLAEGLNGNQILEYTVSSAELSYKLVLNSLKTDIVQQNFNKSNKFYIQTEICFKYFIYHLVKLPIDQDLTRFALEVLRSFLEYPSSVYNCSQNIENNSLMYFLTDTILRSDSNAFLKANIEIIIKSHFYEPETDTVKNDITLPFFCTRQIENIFQSDGPLFAEVLYNICDFIQLEELEDITCHLINLKKGIELDKINTCSAKEFLLKPHQMSLVDLLTYTLVKNLACHVYKNSSASTQMEELNFYCSYENSLKMIVALIERYPLLTDYFLQKKVNVMEVCKVMKNKELTEFLKEKDLDQDMNLLDFIEEYSIYTQNSFRVFYLSLIYNNFKFFKNKGGGYTGSKKVFRSCLLSNLKEKLKKVIYSDDFLRTRDSMYSFKNKMHLVYNLLDWKVKFRSINQELSEFIEWFDFFLEILNKTKIEYSGALLHCNFFDIFGKIYKRILKIHFSKSTGLPADDGDIKHQTYMKFYLNKRLLDYFKKDAVHKNLENSLNSLKQLKEEYKTNTKSIKGGGYDLKDWPTVMEGDFNKLKINEEYDQEIKSLFELCPQKSDAIFSSFSKSLDQDSDPRKPFAESKYVCAIHLWVKKFLKYKPYNENDLNSTLEADYNPRSNHNIRTINIPNEKPDQETKIKNLEEYVSELLVRNYPEKKSKAKEGKGSQSPAKNSEQLLEPSKNENIEGAEGKKPDVDPDARESIKHIESDSGEEGEHELLMGLDFETLGFPKNCLKLYRIERHHFLSLNENDRVNLLFERKEQFENGMNSQMDNQNYFDAVALGYPEDYLVRYGIDEEFFMELPNDMKREVIEGARNVYHLKEQEKDKKRKLEERSSLELIKSTLYLEIEHQEIFKYLDPENEPEKKVDHETFSMKIRSLSKEYKNRVYAFLSPHVVDLLSEDIKSEIKEFKKTLEINDCENQKQPENPINEDWGSSDEEDLDEKEEGPLSIENKGEEDISQKKNVQEKPKKVYLFEKNLHIPEIEKGIDNDEFFLKVPLLSENEIKILLDIFFYNLTNKKEQEISAELITFFKTIQFNPFNSIRILDYLYFLICSKGKKSIASAPDIIKSILPAGALLIQENEVLNLDSQSQHKLSVSKSASLINEMLEKNMSLPLHFLCEYSYRNGFILPNDEGNYNIPRFCFLEGALKQIENSESDSISNSKHLYNLAFELFETTASENLEYVLKIITQCTDKILSHDSLEGEVSSLSKNPYPKYVIDRELSARNMEIIEKITDLILGTNKPIYQKDKSNQEILSILKIFIKKNFNNYSLWMHQVLNGFSKELLPLIKELTKSIEEQIEISKKGIDFNSKEGKLKIARDLLKNPLNSKEAVSLKNIFRIFRLIVRDIVRFFHEGYDIYFEEKNKALIKKELKALGVNAKNQEKSKILTKFETLKANEKQENLTKYKRNLNHLEPINLFYKYLVDILLLLFENIGGDLNHVEQLEIEVVYLFFIFPVKSLLILFEFLDSSQEREEIQEDTLKLPKLAKLMTKELTDAAKKAFVPQETMTSIMKTNDASAITLENTYNGLYKKLMPIMSFYIQIKKEKIKNFLYFIKKAPRPFSMPSSIKFNYIKTHAIERARKTFKNYEETLYINVNRNEIFFSTASCLFSIPPAELTIRPIKVSFTNEEGSDYGGLTREWLALLCKEIFDSNFGLFQLSSNKVSYQPSPHSFIVPNHLMYFTFIGRLFGKILIENKILGINLVKSFLKHILRRTLYISDLDDIDPDMCRNLEWILDNKIEEGVLDLNFSYDNMVLGSIKTVDLMPNGRMIKVTEENKKDYVKRLCYYKMADSIEEQTKAFLKGFEDIIPEEALSLLDEKELGLTFSGMPIIDVEDMKRNTEYEDYGPDYDIIKWLWEILDEFDQNQRANFLFFLSGSFTVPLGGFKDFKIRIQKSYSSENNLPISHTCFNQLDLPKYSTKELMRDKIIKAINEGNTGFYIG